MACFETCADQGKRCGVAREKFSCPDCGKVRPCYNLPAVKCPVCPPATSGECGKTEDTTRKSDQRPGTTFWGGEVCKCKQSCWEWILAFLGIGGRLPDCCKNVPLTSWDSGEVARHALVSKVQNAVNRVSGRETSPVVARSSKTNVPQEAKETDKKVTPVSQHSDKDGHDLEISPEQVSAKEAVGQATAEKKKGRRKNSGARGKGKSRKGGSRSTSRERKGKKAVHSTSSSSSSLSAADKTSGPRSRSRSRSRTKIFNPFKGRQSASRNGSLCNLKSPMCPPLPCMPCQGTQGRSQLSRVTEHMESTFMQKYGVQTNLETQPSCPASTRQAQLRRCNSMSVKPYTPSSGLEPCPGTRQPALPCSCQPTQPPLRSFSFDSSPQQVPPGTTSRPQPSYQSGTRPAAPVPGTRSCGCSSMTTTPDGTKNFCRACMGKPTVCPCHSGGMCPPVCTKPCCMPVANSTMQYLGRSYSSPPSSMMPGPVTTSVNYLKARQNEALCQQLLARYGYSPPPPCHHCPMPCYGGVSEGLCPSSRMCSAGSGVRSYGTSRLSGMGGCKMCRPGPDPAIDNYTHSRTPGSPTCEQQKREIEFKSSPCGRKPLCEFQLSPHCIRETGPRSPVGEYLHIIRVPKLVKCPEVEVVQTPGAEPATASGKAGQVKTKGSPKKTVKRSSRKSKGKAEEDTNMSANCKDIINENSPRYDDPVYVSSGSKSPLQDLGDVAIDDKFLEPTHVVSSGKTTCTNPLPVTVGDMSSKENQVYIATSKKSLNLSPLYVGGIKKSPLQDEMYTAITKEYTFNDPFHVAISTKLSREDLVHESSPSSDPDYLTVREKPSFGALMKGTKQNVSCDDPTLASSVVGSSVAGETSMNNNYGEDSTRFSRYSSSGPVKIDFSELQPCLARRSTLTTSSVASLGAREVYRRSSRVYPGTTSGLESLPGGLQQVYGRGNLPAKQYGGWCQDPTLTNVNINAHKPHRDSAATASFTSSQSVGREVADAMIMPKYHFQLEQDIETKIMELRNSKVFNLPPPRNKYLPNRQLTKPALGHSSSPANSNTALQQEFIRESWEQLNQRAERRRKEFIFSGTNSKGEAPNAKLASPTEADGPKSLHKEKESDFHHVRGHCPGAGTTTHLRDTESAEGDHSRASDVYGMNKLAPRTGHHRSDGKRSFSIDKSKIPGPTNCVKKNPTDTEYKPAFHALHQKPDDKGKEFERTKPGTSPPYSNEVISSNLKGRTIGMKDLREKTEQHDVKPTLAERDEDNTSANKCDWKHLLNVRAMTTSRSPPRKPVQRDSPGRSSSSESNSTCSCGSRGRGASTISLVLSPAAASSQSRSSSSESLSVANSMLTFTKASQIPTSIYKCDPSCGDNAALGQHSSTVIKSVAAVHEISQIAVDSKNELKSTSRASCVLHPTEEPTRTSSPQEDTGSSVDPVLSTDRAASRRSSASRVLDDIPSGRQDLLERFLSTPSLNVTPRTGDFLDPPDMLVDTDLPGSASSLDQRTLEFIRLHGTPV